MGKNPKAPASSYMQLLGRLSFYECAHFVLSSLYKEKRKQKGSKSHFLKFWDQNLALLGGKRRCRSSCPQWCKLGRAGTCKRTELRNAKSHVGQMRFGHRMREPLFWFSSGKRHFFAVWETQKKSQKWAPRFSELFSLVHFFGFWEFQKSIWHFWEENEGVEVRVHNGAN